MKVTKSLLMSYVSQGIHHECFEHSRLGRFDITTMRQRAASLGDKVSVPLDNIIAFIREQRVVEWDRIEALTRESWQDDPGIFIVEEVVDGVPGGVMVDGHHRAFRRLMEGCTDMDFWMIPIEKALRPVPGFFHSGMDWGDPIIDGKIIRSSGSGANGG
jgi:hypothetical protein